MSKANQLTTPPNAGPTTPWMTSKEAAEYLRITVGALRTAVCRGTIRPYKWQRKLYFKRPELDRLIEAGRNGR